MSTPGSTRLLRTLRFALLLAGMAWLPLSQAQVAPTAAETATYRGLHAAAALFHQYVRRDGTLLRMLPQRHQA